MGRLDGKVAVITGAAGGIGREAAILFSAEGARVCVADVGRDAGEKTAAECREAFFQHADVADPGSVAALYEETARRYGGVDSLYNNAGIMPADDDSILEAEPDVWDRVMAVNSRGVFLCCKYGIPHLLKRGGGSVINVRLLRRDPRRGDLTDRLHRLQGRGAVDEPRAGRPVRAPGRPRQCPLSRTG